jgi:hypothetical protein
LALRECLSGEANAGFLQCDRIGRIFCLVADCLLLAFLLKISEEVEFFWLSFIWLPPYTLAGLDLGTYRLQSPETIPLDSSRQGEFWATSF